MKEFSVVIPVYNNSGSIMPLVKRLMTLKKTIAPHLHLIFVNDGSEDDSLQKLKEAQKQYPKHITIIILARNFGSMAAVQAGLAHTREGCVGIIAADLQDPPELLKEMFARWQKGAKVVYAVREGRHDPFMKKVFSACFYRLFRLFAMPDFPAQGFDFVVMDKVVVRDILKNTLHNVFLSGLIFSLGYPAERITYTRQPRHSGRSMWGLMRRFVLAFNAFVDFCHPATWLAIIVFMAFVCSFGSMVLGNKAFWLVFYSMCTLGAITFLGAKSWRYRHAETQPLYMIEQILRKKLK